MSWNYHLKYNNMDHDTPHLILGNKTLDNNKDLGNKLLEGFQVLLVNNFNQSGQSSIGRER
jgi:hypothetical protein